MPPRTNFKFWRTSSRNAPVPQLCYIHRQCETLCFYSVSAVPWRASYFHLVPVEYLAVLVGRDNEKHIFVDSQKTRLHESLWNGKFGGEQTRLCAKLCLNSMRNLFLVNASNFGLYWPFHLTPISYYWMSSANLIKWTSCTELNLQSMSTGESIPAHYGKI